MSIEPINNMAFAISVGNQDVRIWGQIRQQQEGDEASRLVWCVISALKFRDLRVKQLIPNIRLRVGNVSKNVKGKVGATLAILHENGWVSFWAQDGWQYAYSFRLNNPAKSIIFESSSRYLASLTDKGQVEVWRLKGIDAKYEWGLEFNSVTKIEANKTIENQFFVLMSSTDESVQSKQDSLLLFQFSRPQNLIKYWKFKIEISSIRFMDADPAVLLVVNKNQEMQRIYCCDGIEKLKKHGKEKMAKLESTREAEEKKVASQVKVDYNFVQNEKRLERF